jgi:uncharacterized membrane protein YfcA
MFLEIASFVSLFAGGIFAGVLSSVFGLGGGLLVVPLLYWFFHFQGVDINIQMHMAVGTSLVIMLVTTASAIRGKFLRGHILFRGFKSLFLVMFLIMFFAAFFGAIFSYYLNGAVLKYVFMSFLLLVIVQALLNKKFASKYELSDFEAPPLWVSSSVAGVTGFLSVLLGVGGSVFILPLFRHYKLPMEYAAGTALALTPAVALTGAVMYVVTGLHEPNLPSYSLGYLNFPAFIAVAAGSLVGVPMGLKLSAKLEDSLKAKIYLGLLMVILLSMIF